jgi:anti-anti-sigma factor
MGDAGLRACADVILGGEVTRIAVPARLECIDQAVQAFREAIAPRASSRRLFEATAAVREALLNAVLHGCRNDPALLVECVVRVGARTAVVEVGDPGAGFDWKGVPVEMADPTAASGRGLCIMRLYCDEVTFNGAGNAVTLTLGLDRTARNAMNEHKDTWPIVTPGGGIVASMVQDFRNRLKDAAEASPAGFAVDCAGVDQIDSVGLGALIAAHNTLSKTGGSLALINVGEDVLRLLQAMRLDKHFRIGG